MMKSTNTSLAKKLLRKLPNRIFIKLLLGFWLCSSLIIASVGLLPLLQQNHDRAPIPPHLHSILVRAANHIQQQPEILESNKLKRVINKRNYKGKPLRLYILNAQGHIINSNNVSRGLKRFMLMAEEASSPISHQFKSELLFGPHNFDVEGKEFSIYGRIADHHARPWFFFFAENILLTLTLAIILSGLLCGLLAWHLSKPLRSLRLSADALANGDLSSRVDSGTTERLDEIGQLALAFNAMADAVESQVNNQQRLISDISHELRTPLTRLNLALALARKKGYDSPETDRIAYEAQQIELMIAELLELSKVKLNVHEHKKYLGLAEALGLVLDDAEFEAVQQGKSLHIEIAEDIELPLYPKPLSRAIENLLRNAIRYSHSSVSIRVHKAKGMVIIEITDDGPGIENEQDLQSIFKPFYRPQAARDRDSGGWGLGLAITKAAIDAHQGEILAENIQPNGLKVTITLPKQ